MKREFSVLLSGLGYYKLSEQRRRVLLIVLAGSAIVHLIGLIAFGSWVLIQNLREEETVFVAPPPMKTYQPRQLEHKVKVQKRQRSSSRPTLVPRMVAMKPSNFALPEITTDPKVVKTSFQPKFKPVTGSGLGLGLGNGYGLGGFGMGVSEFNFFGIRGRGDKIVMLVDISASMIDPEKGGQDGFEKVRHKIKEVIDALNEQAMFNLVVFADAGNAWQDKLQIANDKNKEAAKKYVNQYNTNLNNLGLSSGNVQSSEKGMAALGGETRLDLALTSAFQQGADTILVISDGLPRVHKEMTSDQRKEYDSRLSAHRQRVDQWQKDHAAELANFKPDPGRMVKKKVWVGQKKDGVSLGGHWEERMVRVGGTSRPRPPGAPGIPDEWKFWTFEDFVKHFTILHQEYYEKKGKKKPTVHAIGYAIDQAGGKFLKDFVKKYNGKYRRVGKVVK